MRVELALVRKLETYLTYLTSEHFSLMEFRVSAKRRRGQKNVRAEKCEGKKIEDGSIGPSSISLLSASASNRGGLDHVGQNSGARR